MSITSADWDRLRTQSENRRMCFGLLCGFFDRSKAENDVDKMKAAYLALDGIYRPQPVKETINADKS